MQFTRLRLSGFKSFVDPTELRIEPGLTGVVGPNGCGKSNLLEALQWVMGETKPKNVRGAGMEDVIFAGTASRAPRNLAEVSLLLDNTARNAPAEFNDASELEISRRIERDAGSAYRVNGREVRARDVQILFADLATGAHSPALVSQGKIGELISAKPRDRRALLEEAAGISGLHSRRHEAELRLRGAETNLERLQDVMAQLETQLAGLKRQARQAARYRSVNSRLRAAEAMMLHVRWQDALTLLGGAREALERAEAEVADRTRQSASATTAQTEAAEKLPPLREEETRAAAALHRLSVERDTLAAEEERLGQAIRALEDRLAQAEQDAAREQERVQDAKTNLARLEEEKIGLEEQEAGHSDQLDEAERQVNRLSDEVGKAEQKVDSLQRNLADLRARRSSLQQRIDDSERRKSRLDQQIAEIRQQLEALRRELMGEDGGDTTEQLRAARTEVEKAEEQLELAHAARRRASEDEEDARSEFEQARDAFGELEAEEKALASVLADHTGERFPPVMDDITVEPGYEAALAAAFGEDLELPLDTDAPVFWRDLGGLGDAPAWPAGVIPLSTVVRGPSALNRALAYVGVMEDDSRGEDLHRQLQAGQVLVCKRGAAWRWDGKVRTADAPSAAAARLEQRNRLDAVREQKQAAQSVLDEARAEWTRLREAADAAAEDEAASREAHRAAEEAVISLREKEAELARQLAEKRSKVASLEHSLEEAGSARDELAETLRNLHQELDAAEPLEELDEALRTAREALAGARDGLAESRATRDSLSREAQSRQTRLSAINQDMSAWAERATSSENQLAQLAQRQETTREELKAMEGKPAEIAESRQRLNDQIAKAEEARQTAANTLAEAESVLSEKDRLLREAQSALSNAREGRVRAEANVEQAEERLATVEVRIREDLECEPEETLDLSEHKPDTPLPDLDATIQKVERLKRERETLGAVNLRAEEEAQEVQEQLDEMANEKADLEAAIARLRQAISSLNREGRERLMAAFTQVDAHFSELFTRLFGGGRAHLALTDSDDPLEAGLEVMASPPGKRLQNMTLLSGGEKALTALALIFSVFLTNPAPICVLDEVDAPLDDANVERVCSLLKEMTRTTGTRFLVVTHNPITMAELDRLFGVTMGERGVSQLVSVDLGRAEQMVAAE